MNAAWTGASMWRRCTEWAPGWTRTPPLFFTLRGIEMERFIDVAIANRVELMLQNATRPSKRIISNSKLQGLFGV